MKIRQDNIFKVLLKEIPEFKNIFDKSVKINKEVVPHIIFGALTRFYIEQFRKKNFESVKKIANFIEKMIDCGEKKIEELAWFSFLENLDIAKKDFYKIEKTLLPKSQKALKEIIKFWKK